MKKFTLIFLATILLCFSCEKLMAQAPYKASVGGILYPSLAVGPSFKVFLTNNIAFQTDMLFKAVFTGSINEGAVLYFLLETNTNVTYQKKFKEKETYELFWLMGGGLSLGYQISGNGKFGVNTIMGFELCAKKIPLTFQMDLRPGYAMLFNMNGSPIETFSVFSSNYLDKNPWHHFDWLLGFTLRYTFKNKIDN